MNDQHNKSTTRLTLTQRQVLSTGFASKYREELIAIERRIMDITGKSSDADYKWRTNHDEFNEVRILLTRRWKLLNLMFMPNDVSMNQFKKINLRLETLCKQLKERMLKLRQSLPLVQDPDFDDDYELTGEIRFCYNDENSVLKSDDEYYGSYFCKMIDIIHTCNYDTYWECIERISPDSPILDDGVSWNEPPFYGRPEFDNIAVCHAIHNLSAHMLYSIPDILRLNDFWAETHLTFQSITTQNGTRLISTS